MALRPSFQRLARHIQGQKASIQSPWCRGSLRFVSFEVGEKVPISFLQDQPDPVIQPDEAYPEWVFRLTKPVRTLYLLFFVFLP